MGPTRAASKCSACGAELVGSPKFCKSCGTRLADPGEAATRVEPAAAQAPPEPSAARSARPRQVRPRGGEPPPPAGPGFDWRRWRLPATAALALIAIAALLFVVLSDDDSTTADRTSQVPSRPPAPVAPADQGPADASVPSEAEVQQLLDTYSDRYEAEDALGLGELFGADALRINADDPPESVSEAIATYQDQFSQLSNPSYVLSGMRIERGPGTADASGRYTISSSQGTVAGTIGFHLAESEGHLVIQRLTITPDG